MKRHRHPTIGLCLAVFLICALIPQPTLADDGSNEKPIRLHATAETGPIGIIHSLNPFTLEGRLARGELAIWGGELIHALPGSSVKVCLDSIGQITLKSAGVARLATRLATVDGIKRHLLIASLVSGELVINLKRDAVAYIESRGSAFTASAGSSFRVEAREGLATIKAENGEVQVEQQATERALKIRPVEVDPGGITPPIDLGLGFDIVTRTVRMTQWQVTDENDKPVPDVPIILTVAGKAIGGFGKSLAPTFTGTTNAQGLVNAPFTAGSSPAQGSITANIPGTNYSSTVEVRVKSKPSGNRNKILIGAAAAVATIVIIVDPRSKDPVKQAPPPTVIP